MITPDEQLEFMAWLYASPFIVLFLAALWNFFTYEKCCECGKTLWPFTRSRLSRSIHAKCHEKIIDELLRDPRTREFTLRELEQWDRRYDK